MRTRYFYLVGKNNNEVNKVDLNDIVSLAKLSMSLTPLQGNNEVAGYYNALQEFMKNNKDNILFDSYNIVTSYMEGIEVLYSNIHFCLYEKKFRESKDNTTPENINAYGIVVNDYHRILDENMRMYEQINSNTRSI